MPVREITAARGTGYLNTAGHSYHHLDANEDVTVEKRADGAIVITRTDWSQQSTYSGGHAVTIVRHL